MISVLLRVDGSKSRGSITLILISEFLWSKTFVRQWDVEWVEHNTSQQQWPPEDRGEE